MNTVEQYIRGLKKAYYDHGAENEWNHFESIKEGVSDEDLKELQTLYPDVPLELMELLNFVDGTYWREYKGEEIAFYFLGSDLEAYPYYLLSARQMVEDKEQVFDIYEDYVNREFEEIPIDEKIIDDASKLCWLHFSDCMNNGGTSQLFIDFSPSKKGTYGQIVRYVHDPDEIEVIANSFKEYLQMLMKDNFDFICEDNL